MAGAPSIVSVVATYDQNFFRCLGSAGIQRPKDENKKSIEIIGDLERMMTEHLRYYTKKNKTPLTASYSSGKESATVNSHKSSRLKSLG